MIYLDHNATTPVRPEVAEVMARALVDIPGNPSSVHGWGRQAREAVEQARFQVARLVGVKAEEIVFTSGGTEGDHTAIRALCAGAARARQSRVLTSPVEHPAVLGAVARVGRQAGPDRPWSVLKVPVDVDGALVVAGFEELLREETAVVSLALANHELGNLYPVGRLARMAQARGVLFHTDAVQAVGKLPVDLGALGVDAATISAHKLGGPKGVGAVYLRRGLDLPPLWEGGHQERERRPGTENVPGIVGFGVACALAAAHLGTLERQETLRADLLAALRSIPGARFFGASAAEAEPGAAGFVGSADKRGERLPGTVMVGFPGAPGQLVAIGLDLEGICVSTGAACTSGSLQPSPVLRALGLSAREAAEGVRISLGWTTTAADITRLGEVLPAIVARVRGAQPVASSTVPPGQASGNPTGAEARA